MKQLWFLGMAALLFPAWGILVAAQSGPPHRAIFEYSMGSLAEGKIQGECSGQAALFEAVPGGFSFESAGGQLERYTTEFNFTALDPHQDNEVWFPVTAEQFREDHLISAGPGSVLWNESGKTRIFAAGWPYAAFENDDHAPLAFDARYEVESLQTGRPSVVDAGTFFVEWNGQLGPDEGGVSGTNTVLSFASGSVQVTGDVTLYLQATDVSGPDGFSFEGRPYWENVTTYENELVGYYRIRAHHVLLRLSDARIRLDASEADLACLGGSGRIEGSLLAYRARGNVQAGNESVSFDRQELLLQGTMEYRESVQQSTDPGAGKVAFEGQGQFTAVGIDFENAGIVHTGPPSWAKLGFWALLAAGAATVIAYVTKALWPLYSRLEKPALLDRVTRTHVVDALRNTPWMNVAELQRSTGLGRSTLRYQLAVLARHGIVKSRRTGWGPRFAVRLDGAPPPVPPADPIDNLVRREAGVAPIRLSILMRLIQAECSLSKTGAWKAIQKRVRNGVVLLERRDEGVWVRYQTAS